MSEYSQSVRRRRVFYIPGYDPLPARRYRELYRTEGASQAQISGYDLELTGTDRSDGFSWGARTKIDGHMTEAQIDVLRWSDIVQASMPDSIGATYMQMLRTTWTYIVTGTFRRLTWVAKGPVVAALYPIVVLILQALVALLIPSILLSIISNLANSIDDSIGIQWPAWLAAGWNWMTWSIGWALTLGGAYLILQWFKAKDGKIYAYYLMHDYAYTASQNGAYPALLSDRITEFSEQVAEALASDVDEVLVVGHSSGAMLAVSVVANLMRDHKAQPGGPELALLTIGEAIPMLSFLPKARQLRADLAYLSTSDQIVWIDVTAPGDGCSFALCDPVAVSGVAPDDQKWPTVFSAAFTQSLSQEKQDEMQWRFFRRHFQYLCAFDKPRDYDYFQITAGPRSLRDRYANRVSSHSRIDVAASKYTSIAA
ncbi:hypothetical protein AADZ90_009330 [Aestuariibius sp. 2305UL40-4]|uniref:hypothetical protein n=1 Tax=Aestuariibius violaceus TaxID=3234132 RepID=UPI00345E2855